MKKTTGNNISRTVSNGGGMEANTLAILDSSTYDSKNNSRDVNDDRISYLEAVRAASLIPENGIPPTNKMYEAVFRILKSGKTLELLMSSYQLLNELDKRFPRVSCSGSREVEIVVEAWTPFVFGVDAAPCDREMAGKSAAGILFDSSSFHQLIQELNESTNETNSQVSDMKMLGNMLLFQYLVNVLEGDFGPRNHIYRETMNWDLLKESLLNMLLASRRINYKALMKDCVSKMCQLHNAHAMISNNEDSKSSEGNPPKNGDSASKIGVVEAQRNTCMAMKTLLIMIMELDASKKKADSEGFTTRADGVRTPLAEILVDELTYNRVMFSPFLQVFDDPKWKLEIILQYFSKYIAKPSVRTRRSNGPSEDSTLSGVLKCFSNNTSARNIVKKIGVDVVQLLLGHAFQAHLSLPFQQRGDPPEQKDGSSLAEICDGVVSAFSTMKRLDEKMEILPFGKAAVFTAAMLLSTNS